MNRTHNGFIFISLTRRSFFVAIAVFVLLNLQNNLASASERLVYSVHSNRVIAGNETGKFIWKQSTSIYVWDTQTKKTTKVFSDRDEPTVLLIRYGSGQYQERVIIPFKDRIFAVGAKRKAGESETSLIQAGSLYELTLDGSNHVREIAPVESTFPLDFITVSVDGKKIAYVGSQKLDNGEQIPFLIVIDKEGKRLVKTPLDAFLKDCRVSWLEWSNDSQSLHWRLEPAGDAHTETETGINKAGTYVTRWDGIEPRRVPIKFLQDGIDKVRSPSGKFIAERQWSSPRPGDMETGEIWLQDNHNKTRIISVSPFDRTKPRQGIGAENHFLSLLGWLD